MIDIGGMTANQIDAEISDLAKLEKKGDLTVDGTFRLQELRRTRRAIGVMGRRRWL